VIYAAFGERPHEPVNIFYIGWCVVDFEPINACFSSMPTFYPAHVQMETLYIVSSTSTTKCDPLARSRPPIKRTIPEQRRREWGWNRRSLRSPGRCLEWKRFESPTLSLSLSRRRQQASTPYYRCSRFPISNSENIWRLVCHFAHQRG